MIEGSSSLGSQEMMVFAMEARPLIWPIFASLIVKTKASSPSTLTSVVKVVTNFTQVETMFLKCPETAKT